MLILEEMYKFVDNEKVFKYLSLKMRRDYQKAFTKEHLGEAIQESVCYAQRIASDLEEEAEDLYDSNDETSVDTEDEGVFYN